MSINPVSPTPSNAMKILMAAQPVKHVPSSRGERSDLSNSLSDSIESGLKALGNTDAAKVFHHTVINVAQKIEKAFTDVFDNHPLAKVAGAAIGGVIGGLLGILAGTVNVAGKLLAAAIVPVAVALTIASSIAGTIAGGVIGFSGFVVGAIPGAGLGMMGGALFAGAVTACLTELAYGLVNISTLGANEEDARAILQESREAKAETHKFNKEMNSIPLAIGAGIIKACGHVAVIVIKR